MTRPLVLGLLGVFLVGAPARGDRGGRVDFRGDVTYALDELEERCGHFFRPKGIEWRKVEREFRKEARRVRTVEEHWVLLVRLVARLEDGHARVEPLPSAGDLQWPLAPERRQTGPGMFWCRSGDRVLVKNAWSAAEGSGVRPGMEVVEVDGEPALEWIEARTAERRDLMGFSTDHQAFFATCHWGLAGDEGSPMRLSLRAPDGDRKKVTVTRRRASTVPVGPAFPPPGLERIGRQSYGRTPAGHGYVHLRDVPSDLPAQMDAILGALGEVPGLILDCRANGGGGCDHDAVLGRFVPAGEELRRRGAHPIPSAGSRPYGGPLVVIVDAGCRSAGETVAGMFKEDGRAYVIGESPTAGMSSQKERFTLPSGLFALQVSVRSNKQRFNDGKGIEGLGVAPHEVVTYEAEDLARGVDTLIRRAEELLADFPPGYGWPR